MFLYLKVHLVENKVLEILTRVPTRDMLQEFIKVLMINVKFSKFYYIG